MDKEKENEQEKLKPDKDVLIVTDNKTGERGVVTGMNSIGNPIKMPVRKEYSQSFLQFDKNGNALDNFFTNFVRQCKEPTRFGFTKTTTGALERLFAGAEEAKAEIEGESINPSNYINNKNKKKMEQNQSNNAAEAQSQQAESNKHQYQPIDETKVNWADIQQKWGVTRDQLEQSGDLNKMLNYGKSNLITVHPAFGGEQLETAARLSFKKNEDGSVSLVPHLIRKEANLEQEYKGHTFSEADKSALKNYGNMGRVVDLLNDRGERVPSIISIDRQTNEITDLPVRRLRIPEKIGNTELTKQEQDMLRAGLPLKNKEIELANGRKFTTTLQANVEEKGVEFVPRGYRQRNGQEQRQEGNQQTEGQAQDADGDGAQKQRRPQWTDENGNIKPIGKWKGVEFTDEQKRDYLEGNTIKLDGVPDKQGVPSTMYLKFSPEKGRPLTYANDPDKAVTQTPASESQTQVAVNSEGKTNEQTKGVKEPLQQSQTAPKDTKQKEQQDNAVKQDKPEKKKSKGMKM